MFGFIWYELDYTVPLCFVYLFAGLLAGFLIQKASKTLRGRRVKGWRGDREAYGTGLEIIDIPLF